jgi:hypothetical protein
MKSKWVIVSFIVSGWTGAFAGEYSNYIHDYISRRVDYCKNYDSQIPSELNNWLNVFDTEEWKNNYESISDPKVMSQWTNNACYSAYWHPVNEIFSAIEVFKEYSDFDLKFIDEEIKVKIGSDCIILTGTSMGRSALGPLIEYSGMGFVVSVNALSDGTYLNYISNFYRGAIWLPSSNDAREIYLSSDMVALRNEIGLCERYIGTQNSILAERIVNNNLGKNVFLDEGYEMLWALERSSPFGMLLLLSNQQSSLSDEEIQRLLIWHNEIFERKEELTLHTRKNLARSKSAIAALLLVKGYSEASDVIFQQAIDLDSSNSSINSRYILGVLVPSRRFEESIFLLNKLPDSDMTKKLREIILEKMIN